MRVIGTKDIASLSLRGRLGEGSLPSLSLLYGPLLGASGIGFYHLLYALSSSNRLALSFEALSRQSELSLREIDDEMRKLEALGLLKTYLQEEGEAHVYTLCLYPPHAPKSFFADWLLSGKLRERLGEEGYRSCKKIFEAPSLPSDAKEVSASFEEVFGLPEPAMKDAFLGGEEEGPASIKTGFDPSAFAEGLSSYGASLSLFSEEELSCVEQAYALYGYDSHVLGEFAADCLKRSARCGNKLDRQAFKRKCESNFTLKHLRPGIAGKSPLQGEGVLSRKARMMDEMPPARFLACKQRGHRPASSDLRLLERLIYEIGLPAPAVNAVVDYVLATNDGVLNAALVEKIAATLVRKGIDNARDAMDDLYATRSNAIKRTGGKKKERFAPEAPKEGANESEEEASEEEMNALLEQLYGKKE